jgi:hypothetical protein
MIHVVFQQADVKVLQQAMELDEILKGEVFEIKDEWGVGPLAALDTEEGWVNRSNWWKMLLKDSPYGEQLVDSFDDRQTVEQIKSALNADTTLRLWIWIGQNHHDVVGYYWLMSQLKEFQGRIMIIYLNNLPFINDKGLLFFPTSVHDILPKEAIKAKRLARPITLSEFEVDPDEWKKIVEENTVVRILDGGKKILAKQETFYDNEILKNLTAEWQKATRVLSNTLHRMRIKTGDVFVMWRMKQLIQQGKIEVMGDINKGWKEFDVKLTGAKQNEEAQPEQATV